MGHDLFKAFRVAVVGLLLGCAVFISASTASASDLLHHLPATHIYKALVYLQANTAYASETDQLSGGADTVLHVQSFTDGSFVDGNDDCGTRLAGCGGFRSYVSLPSAPTSRNVWVLVRAFGFASGGSATLRITPSGGTSSTYPIAFASGYYYSMSAYPAAAHFQTVEEQGGSPDTRLLVLSQYAWKAIAFDDDHGVDRMSFVHTPEACSTNCVAIVASNAAADDGNTTLLWDDDGDGADTDGDGLSDGFEYVVAGTDRFNPDDDEDGISDYAELVGVDASPAVKLPYYGASPTHRDLFLEADWVECADPGCSNLDDWQLQPNHIADTAALYPPDVSFHVDNGLANTDPNTWEQYGAWGGATRHSKASKNNDLCQWRTSSRWGYFHFARMEGVGGGVGSMGGTCFDTGYVAHSVAHELGHNVNLTHGGKQSNSLDMNCKPNYPSLMNYGVQYDFGFSRNQFAGYPLNPAHLNETAGLSPLTAEKLALLRHPSFDFDVNLLTGAVDWNRDGRSTDTDVPGAPTWGFAFAGCQVTDYRRDMALEGTTQNALTRYPVSADETRIYWFSRDEASNRIVYRRATSFPENCGYPPAASCKTNWVPAVGLSAYATTNGEAAASGPAATWFWDTTVGAYKLLLVYRNSANRLRYQIFNGTWSTPASIPGSYSSVFPGTGLTSGEPAVAVSPAGTAYLYAIVSGVLKQWTFSGGSFANPTTQVWAATSSPIQPAYGIGVTHGYVLPSTSSRMVAAVPLASPLGQVEFAWKDWSSASWERLPDANWPPGATCGTPWTICKPVTQGKPALAYVPFDRDQSLTSGRFYLAWNPSAAGVAMLMTQSQGNQFGGIGNSRRLEFNQPAAYYYNTWATGEGGVALLYDLGYDRNLRGAFTYEYEDDNQITHHQDIFSPYADGIIDGVLRDQDDFPPIRNGVNCSLRGTCQ